MPDPTFTVEAFCKDPDFIRWVLTPTPESNRFWQAFIADNPHKAADIRLAVDYVKTIHFQEINPSEKDLARLKHRIWTDIQQLRPSGPGLNGPVRTDLAEQPSGRVSQWYQRPYWAAVAMALLIALVGAGWWVYRANAGLTYQTAYGKIQEIRLVDGSVVTLNANSALKVANDLANSPVREVWLNGEAYFAIAKRAGTKFIVHTPEAQVEVLGTEFNVNTRREQTNVVLHEGKVQLSADNQSTVVLKPGDMATVLPRNRHIQLKRVQPDNYDAWKEAYIVLDGKSLPEIINSLQDTFGVKIKLEDTLLVSKKLSGKLRTEVADDCIENLSTILDAEVEKSGDVYLFK